MHNTHTHVQGTHAHPHNTHASNPPNNTHTIHTQVLLEEVFDRNVLWVCRETPSLANTNLDTFDEGGVAWERLHKSFKASVVSLRLLMFHVHFLETVAKPVCTVSVCVCVLCVCVFVLCVLHVVCVVCLRMSVSVLVAVHTHRLHNVSPGRLHIAVGGCVRLRPVLWACACMHACTVSHGHKSAARSGRMAAFFPGCALSGVCVCVC